MENFPNVSDEKVILLRSEYDTGHVLDEKFNLSINPEQKIYSVYDGIGDALAYIKTVFSERNDIEFTIYDNKKKVLHFFRTRDDLSRQTE